MSKELIKRIEALEKQNIMLIDAISKISTGLDEMIRINNENFGTIIRHLHI